MEETVAECIGTYVRWVYFRKKTSEGPFDLYSDYDSRINHYKRVAAFTGIAISINLIAMVGNIIIGIVSGIERGFYFNIYISLINLAIVIAFTPMFISYLRRIKKMKEERNIYE